MTARFPLDSERARTGPIADLCDAIRLYARYVGVSLRGQMQYRASFAMLTLGQLFATGIEFVGVVALFARFGNLRGWTLPEVALFYGLVGVAFSIADMMARGFDQFGNMVKSGDFDRLLLRPRGTAFQLAAKELVLTRAGRFAQALFVLLWAMTTLRLHWTPTRLALIALIEIGGACLFYGLFVLQATLAFWTVESLEIMNTVTYGGTETAQYPMTIYRPWFRRFFTFVVPLACINYLPVSLILERSGRRPAPALSWQGASPLVGVLFLLVSLQVWKRGERKYVSTGS